jgi:hypothetical protein
MNFGCAKKYAGVPSKRALKTGAAGKYIFPRKRVFKKREAHKKAPLKKRPKMNLTSLHILGRS